MLAGNFAGTGKTIRDPLNNNTPFPGNIIPQNRLDPISQKMIQYFPHANLTGRAGRELPGHAQRLGAPRPGHRPHRPPRFREGQPVRPLLLRQRRLDECRVHHRARRHPSRPHAAPLAGLHPRVFADLDQRYAPRLFQGVPGPPERRRPVLDELRRRRSGSRISRPVPAITRSRTST